MPPSQKRWIAATPVSPGQAASRWWRSQPGSTVMGLDGT